MLFPSMSVTRSLILLSRGMSFFSFFSENSAKLMVLNGSVTSYFDKLSKMDHLNAFTGDLCA